MDDDAISYEEFTQSLEDIHDAGLCDQYTCPFCEELGRGEPGWDDDDFDDDL